jgi:DNA-binding LacI/PurR family transcriptional regulator
MDYLERIGVAVPARVALAGFDDTTDAHQRQLTSLNFNYYAASQMLLANVFETAAALSVRKRRQPVEIQGFINERRSTTRRGGGT